MLNNCLIGIEVHSKNNLKELPQLMIISQFGSAKLFACVSIYEETIYVLELCSYSQFVTLLLCLFESLFIVILLNCAIEIIVAYKYFVPSIIKCINDGDKKYSRAQHDMSVLWKHKGDLSGIHVRTIFECNFVRNLQI